uniref:Uncharacterized protein n=1 Tax=Romanomermis culicivorax TaxID=13658 RepID=A0A915HLS1_ROMCU
MGLSVNDEDDSDDSRPGSPALRCAFINRPPLGPFFSPLSLLDPMNPYLLPSPLTNLVAPGPPPHPKTCSSSKKRRFNVDSLLAAEDEKTPSPPPQSSSPAIVVPTSVLPCSAHSLPTSMPFLPAGLFGAGSRIGCWPFGLWPPNQFAVSPMNGPQSPPASCSSSSPPSSNGESPKQQQQPPAANDAVVDQASDNASQISEGRSSPNAAQWQVAMKALDEVMGLSREWGALKVAALRMGVMKADV